MADYIVPRVEANQQFTQIPVFTAQPQAVLVLGPQYKLNRYAIAAEKADTIVTHSTAEKANRYQPADTVVYPWTNKLAASTVDQSYVKLFLEKAQGKYFPLTALGSGSETGVVTRVPITAGGSTYHANRFSIAGLNFKSGNGYAAHDYFGGINRGVKVGDVVVVKDSGTGTVTTKVKDFIADVVPASLGTPSQDLIINRFYDYVAAAYGLTASESNSVAAVGSYTGITFAISDTPNYEGYPSLGIKSDTYEITCTTGGTVSAARFSVTSAKNAFTAKTELTLGSQLPGNATTISTGVLDIDVTSPQVIKALFTLTSSNILFSSGHKWTWKATAPIQARVLTSAGTYTGSLDRIYKITVTRGGPFYTGSNAATCARVYVTSSIDDSSAIVNATSVTAAGFTVGSYNITAVFNASAEAVFNGLYLGDVFYVPAVAAKNSNFRTIVTQDSLDVLSGWESTPGSTYSIVLAVEKNAAIDEIKNVMDGTKNWTTSASGITINSDIAITETGFNNGADPAQLPVIAANLFVERRDLLKTRTTVIESLTDTGLVESKLGVIHPDNALAQGVYSAALNSNGTPVYYVGVASDDLSGYNAALTLARKSDDYYSIVPLSFDKTVRDAVISHVNTMSDAKQAKERMAWVSEQLMPTSLVYSYKNDGTNWMITVSDDPTQAGNNYTVITMVGAHFITDGVRIGDVLLSNYRLDAANRVINDEFTVSEVRTETTLVVSTAFATVVTVAIKAKVARVYSLDEQAASYALRAGEYNNRRVQVLFPDTYKAGSVDMPGYFLAASVAGLAAGTVPHQGLTNVELLGPTDLTKSVNLFTDVQLNTMAGEGVMIVTQAVIGATAYVRHQLTSDRSGLNTSELSITRNVDSITRGLRNKLKPYIGVYNINPGSILQMRTVVDAELRFRLVTTETARAGNQLNGYKILNVAQDTTFKDRVNIKVQLDVPAPVNNIVIDIIV